MTPKKTLEEACETIDCALFSGDNFQGPEERVALREYIARWSRELNKISVYQAEENDVL